MELALRKIKKMDDKLKEIIKQTDITELEKLPLFESQETSSFGEFLKEERIRPFIQLHILNKFLETEFEVYFKEKIKSKTVYDEEVPRVEETDEGPENIGTFSGKRLFQFILQNFGFEQISAQDPARITTFYSQGEYSWTLKRMVLVSKEIIITPKEIFTKKHDLLEGIITHHNKEFLDLLRQANNIGISHTTYIELLKKWFPKEVHIRILE